MWVNDESTVSNDATRLICQRTLADERTVTTRGRLGHKFTVIFGLQPTPRKHLLHVALASPEPP